MNNSPKLWMKLLAESPKGSVLMGGAVVDYAMFKQPKDYDIWCTYNPMNPWIPPANWTLTNMDFNNPEWVKEHEEQYLQGVAADGLKPIAAVNEYLVDNEHLVQIIAVHYANPADHFQNFDHSFTLGRFTKSGMFIHRKVFEARDSGIIEYVSKNKHPEAMFKSLKRAHAKANKYDHWGHHEWKFKGFGKGLI